MKKDPKCITILIDFLGRKGDDYHLNEAENLYNKYIGTNIHLYYKFKVNALSSLLSSCYIHNDMIRGQRIFNKIDMILNDVDCNDNNIKAPIYITLSNLYGQNDKFDKVNEIREILTQQKIK